MSIEIVKSSPLVSFSATKVKPVKVEEKERTSDQPLKCDNSKIIKKLASFDPDTKNGIAVVNNQHGVFVLKLKNGKLVKSTKYAPVQTKLYDYEAGKRRVCIYGPKGGYPIISTHTSRNKVEREYCDKEQGYNGDLHSVVKRKKSGEWTGTKQKVQPTTVRGKEDENCFVKLTEDIYTHKILDKTIVDSLGNQFMTQEEAQKELNLAIQTYKQAGLLTGDLSVPSLEDLQKDLEQVQIITGIKNEKSISGMTPNGIKRTIFMNDEKVTGIMENHPKSSLGFHFDSDGKLSTIQTFNGKGAYGYDNTIKFMKVEEGKVTYLHFDGYADIFDKEDDIRLA